MADLRIVDAPEIPTENITGEEKLPTGGSGNYSISLDSLADYTKTKKDLVDNTTVDSKVNGVRQELTTHIEDLLNPHQVTKGQIGLGNVDNTADADKPVSNSTQSAIISAVSPKADKTYVDNQLTLKANKGDVYTKQESGDLVNNSISTALTPVNTSLDLAKRGIANRYDSSLTYNSGERVVLTNGDIVKSTIDGNTNDPNTDLTGWEKPQALSVFDESGLNQQQVNGIKSISDLRTTNPSKKGAKVFLLSANLDQDEGGGDFIATQKSGLVDNGGTIIASANHLLFWVRVNYDIATFEMFGAKGDDPSFDNNDPIHRCVNSVSSASMYAKWYYTSEGIEIPDTFKKLTGVSQDVSRIIKTTNNTKVVDGGALIDYTLYFKPMVAGDPNTYYKDFSGFEVRKIDSLFLTPNSYGVYLNRLALSMFKNMRIVKFETGIHAKDCWMTTWERVTVHAGKVGWNLQTGTSNVMTACWVISPTDTAYIFNNMLYSVMNGCGCDFAGSEGAPANAIISSTFSQLTIIGMGYEKSHLYKFLYSNGSRVSLINVRGLSNENKYSTGRASWIEAENSSNIIVDGGTFGLKYKKGDQPNVPNALFLGNSSVYDDRRSDLFRTYSINTDIAVFDSNAFFETNGYRKEIIKDPLSTDKVVMSDRRYLSNNGLSFAQDPDTIQYNGNYHINSANPMGFMMLQHINHSQNSNYAFQFGAPAGESNCRNVKMRIKNNGVWSTPCTVRNTDNTTVDANGFIKSASPIVKLFSDHIETNNEVPDIVTFEKMGVGDYLIKNTKGFSTEGWYVELPQDANGNKLFAVVYEQLVNGDISVKTYQRKFDIETASIVADLINPIDIKEGRWIDIRLN